METPQFNEIPDNIRDKLTKEELEKIEKERWEVLIYKTTRERLEWLKKALEWTDIAQKLDDNDLEEVVKSKEAKEPETEIPENEKGILDKVWEVAENIKDWVKNIGDTVVWASTKVVDSIPGVSTAKKWTQFFEKIKEAFSNPSKFFKELMEAIKNAFKWNINKLKELFSFGLTAEEAIGVIEKKFDLGYKELGHWKELFNNEKFKNIKIEDLLKFKNSQDPKKDFGLDIDNRIIKTFLDKMFWEKRNDNKNFEEFTQNIKNSGKSEVDINDLTLWDVLQSNT